MKKLIVIILGGLVLCSVACQPRKNELRTIRYLSKAYARVSLAYQISAISYEDYNYYNLLLDSARTDEDIINIDNLVSGMITSHDMTNRSSLTGK